MGAIRNTRKNKRRKILKDALIEISPYFTNLNYTKNYGTAKGHRVVVSYTFTFEPENPKKILLIQLLKKFYLKD
ncbi:hypothetical protein [Lactobacillus jensenii]|uniref:hypothetical protein n=1 Tax=Lactobacillus jensenii TaxID=109790 RepID=UPI0035BE5827